jgi:NADH:ubiquinone oxidoreductase subunit F (NADH-binding)
MLKKILSVFIVTTFLMQSLALAEALTPPSEDAYKSRLSEYFYSVTGREVLKPIKLLGSVSKPGLYHLPEGTSLTTLLSISGGFDKDADVKEMHVTKVNGTVQTKNFDELMKSNNDLKLQDGDVVYVPRSEGLFNQPTTNTITVLSSIVTVLLTGYLVIHTTN